MILSQLILPITLMLTLAGQALAESATSPPLATEVQSMTDAAARSMDAVDTPQATTENAALRDTLLELERGNAAMAVSVGTAALTATQQPELRVQLLVALAAAYQSLGHYPESNAALNEAGALVDTTESGLDNILYLSAMGDYLLAIGKTKEAEKSLRTGIEQARALKRPLLLARLLNNLGNLQMVGWAFAEANASYTEAMTLSQEGGDTSLTVSILFNRAQTAFRGGHPQEAAQLVQEYITAAQSLPAGHARAYALISGGRLAYRIKESDASLPPQLHGVALQAFAEAIRWGEQQEARDILSFGYGFQAQLYEAQKRYPEALRLTWKALYQAQKLGAPEHLYLWQWQAGRLARLEGRLDEALPHYRQAVETLRMVRVDLNRGLRNAPESFRELIGPVYYGLADLLLRKSEKSQNEQERHELLLSARNTIEALKTAELQNLLQDQCLLAQDSGRASLDQVDVGTMIYYPILLEDRLEILLTTSQGIRRLTVPVTSKELEEEARQFRLKLEETDNEAFLVHAQRLHHWLIQPIQAIMAEDKTAILVVVPDGYLRTIPLAALHDGTSFVAERVALAVTPSLKLTDTKTMERQDTRILINALSQGVQGFTPLPNVPMEIDRIRKISPSVVFKDEAFTLENITNSFKEESYPIIHIASHGQFNRDPQNNFLLTYDGKLTIDKLEEMIGSGRFRDSPVELLTLSACQTAVGDDRAALGLAGVAVKAGARSAMATLWFVDDEATSLLIADFYDRLINGKLSKAKALQAAQRGMIANEKLRHPGFWAPFILIGNWT